MTKEGGPTAEKINKRNRKLQNKVTIIILTAFFCWVPFVLFSLLHYFEVLDATPQYEVFSIIVLPINAVINPFLYSEIVENAAHKIWAGSKVLREYVRKICISTQKVEETEMVELRNKHFSAK